MRRPSAPAAGTRSSRPARPWRWLAYLAVLGIWVLAGLRLLADPVPRLPLLFNWTPSLPWRVAWLHRGVLPAARGELVLYAFDGAAADSRPGLRHQPFFKVVRGLPGDVVTVRGREVSVNGQAVGVALERTRGQRPLEPIAPGAIPPGHYYVQGTSPDSFDSRYRAGGLVPAGQVIGTVTPLL
ncbi:conjugative transfer signal peptidase TraF [Azohydromonas australica]|uniref:conjugative transfer signal peptidase TraF n=1 Tax=Azohydromonas australica TaxID=364039 RepID=UPI0003F59D9A|nr:conjugative transfer signal peptidase TraF [Azohydromonas australica]